jgi:hypothetical protein
VIRRVRKIVRLIGELFRALGVLPLVEAGRHREGPRPLAKRLRARGLAARARSPEGRRAMLQAIAFVDRLAPGPASCYRRALMELALDPQSAREDLVLGLRAHGGARSGHAWTGPRSPAAPTYDVELSI